jgi:DNA-binding MarR family transcriptional regulator
MTNFALDKLVWLPYNMFMMNIKKPKTISLALLDVAEEYNTQERKTRYYGTDVPIFYAEIHTLMMIVEQPGIHVVGLAEKLEVNKASASELVIKLEKKGLVEKRIGEDKRSKLAIFPTEKGLLAHKNHMHYHEMLDKLVQRQTKDLSPEVRSEILDFLLGVSGGLRKLDIAGKPNTE